MKGKLKSVTVKGTNVHIVRYVGRSETQETVVRFTTVEEANAYASTVR